MEEGSMEKDIKAVQEVAQNLAQLLAERYFHRKNFGVDILSAQIVPILINEKFSEADCEKALRDLVLRSKNREMIVQAALSIVSFRTMLRIGKDYHQEKENRKAMIRVLTNVFPNLQVTLLDQVYVDAQTLREKLVNVVSADIATAIFSHVSLVSKLVD